MFISTKPSSYSFLSGFISSMALMVSADEIIPDVNLSSVSSLHSSILFSRYFK